MVHTQVTWRLFFDTHPVGLAILDCIILQPDNTDDYCNASLTCCIGTSPEEQWCCSLKNINVIAGRNVILRMQKIDEEDIIFPGVPEDQTELSEGM